MYKLYIEDDEGKTTVVPIIRDEITIGRKEGNTIRLTERNVSRRHARIIRQNGAIYIEDLLSYNGIKVNGERIQNKVVIGDGDRIQIGDYQLSIKLDKTESKPPAPGTPSGEGQTTPFVKPDGGVNSTAPTVQNQAVSAAALASSLPTVQHPAVAPVKVPDKPARLIVISSNFARQEFPLDKAAVVVGRTDDNDVVLNHRSISRHHAKIVREGEKFHIVDLQSANGVRVNGEEYGKVELRRGDQIDLGHVRLIFVPPGQDIDIKDKIVHIDEGRSSSKIAVVLVALMLIGGGAAFYWYRLRPQPVEPDVEAAKLLVDVDSDLNSKRWSEAINKATRVLQLPEISLKTKEAAQNKKARADLEARAKPLYDRFADAAGSGNYDEAMADYREIPEESVYRQSAREGYDKLIPMFVQNHLDLAAKARAKGDCAEDSRQIDIVLKFDPKNVKGLAAKDLPCKAPGQPEPGNVVAVHQPPKNTPKQNRPPRQEQQQQDQGSEKPAPADSANVEETLTQAQTEFVNAQYGRSIELARSVLKANPVRAWRIIGAAACNIKDLKLINDAFRRLDPPGRQYLIYVCQRQGINNSGSQFKMAEPPP